MGAKESTVSSKMGRFLIEMGANGKCLIIAWSSNKLCRLTQSATVPPIEKALCNHCNAMEPL